MKLRVPVAAGLTTLSLLGTGLVAAAPAHANTPGPALKAAPNCNAWISGEWGHGKCTRLPGTGDFPMRLDVICDAWWDADVHKRATVRAGQTVELQGHCNSSVSGVSAGWG